jgi:hypothetical protein
MLMPPPDSLAISLSLVSALAEFRRWDMTSTVIHGRHSSVGEGLDDVGRSQASMHVVQTISDTLGFRFSFVDNFRHLSVLLSDVVEHPFP